MKHITIIGNIDVIPAGQDQDGTDVKELILHDPDTNEIIHYKMTQELATTLGRKFKMANANLVADMERAAARARIEMPGQQNGGIPLSPEVERHLRGQG